MIDLYYWPTPNGWKLTILFEELGIPYNVIPVDINKGEQFEQDFLTIAPNNRMPAVVDSEGADSAPLSLFESGAIMLHYADKHGRFIPADERGRAEVLQWLFFQMGNVGPMLGQCHHFRNYAPEKLPYAIERYVNETSRLYRVVNKRLADRDWVAGDYSIADMAVWPWTARHNWQEIDLNEFPNVRRWYMTMLDRPAVKRGWNVPENDQPLPVPE